jgi:hypothetical protein
LLAEGGLTSHISADEVELLDFCRVLAFLMKNRRHGRQQKLSGRPPEVNILLQVEPCLAWHFLSSVLLLTLRVFLKASFSTPSKDFELWAPEQGGLICRKVMGSHREHRRIDHWFTTCSHILVVSVDYAVCIGVLRSRS